MEWQEFLMAGGTVIADLHQNIGELLSAAILDSNTSMEQGKHYCHHSLCVSSGYSIYEHLIGALKWKQLST